MSIFSNLFVLSSAAYTLYLAPTDSCTTHPFLEKMKKC